MAKIVAFSVPSKADGDKALDELEGVADVKDVAMAYKNDKGKVKIVQTSDATVPGDMFRGALIGAVASIFVGPLGGMAAGGAVAGGAYGALRDKGVNDKVMKLAGKQLDQGQAAVFVLAEDGKAEEIKAKLESLSHLKQYQGEIEVGEFSADAQKEVKEHLKNAQV